MTVVDAFNTPLDRADSGATMMVDARPDAIMTAGSLTRVLQRGTETIPIVTVSDDLSAESRQASLQHHRTASFVTNRRVASAKKHTSFAAQKNPAGVSPASTPRERRPRAAKSSIPTI
jgi:hypothetical protein